MATPPFILELRSKIGHAPLWIPGCTAVVLRPAASSSLTRVTGASVDLADIEVLMVKRADNGKWTPVTGIVDPGEEPAVAAEREIREEAGVEAVAQRLLSVEVVGPVTYPNGDVSSYLDCSFVCEWKQGEPWPADGENTEAAFFPANDLPPTNERFRTAIKRALLGEDGSAVFNR